METSRSFSSGGFTLSGTLTVPGGGGPGVLLISGSGPLDRDSNTKRMPIDAMRQIAQHLSAEGFATYRKNYRAQLRRPVDVEPFALLTEWLPAHRDAE